jgi:hypothetical protein
MHFVAVLNTLRCVQSVGVDEHVEWIEPNYIYAQHQILETAYSNGSLWVSRRSASLHCPVLHPW